MTTVYVPAGAPLEPAPKQVARNGLYPQAFHAARLRGLANHIARYRTKQVCHFASTRLDRSIVVGGGGPGSNDGFAAWAFGDVPRERWRCVYHSSPYASRLRVILATMRPYPDSGAGLGPFTPPSSHRITVGITGTTLCNYTIPSAPAQVTFPNDYALGPENIAYRYGIMADDTTGAPFDVPPDTDLQLVIAENPMAQTLSVLIYEEALEPDTSNGYIDPAAHTGTPILASGRSGVATILNSMWKRGASHIFNWATLIDTTGVYAPRTIASATSTNLIDQTSTGAVSATSAGFIADLANTKRLNDTGANVKVWVYGKNSVAANGQVKLLQSGGAAVNVGPFATSLGWVSGTGQLLSNGNKLDLQFSTASGTLTVEAVSVLLQD